MTHLIRICRFALILMIAISFFASCSPKTSMTLGDTTRAEQYTYYGFGSGDAEVTFVNKGYETSTINFCDTSIVVPARGKSKIKIDPGFYQMDKLTQLMTTTKSETGAIVHIPAEDVDEKSYVFNHITLTFERVRLGEGHDVEFAPSTKHWIRIP